MAVVATAALALSAGGAWAENWPTKPVKLINGYPPGGGADILARLVAGKLTEALGQQVIVDNRTGATGLIAAGAVASAAPDGYTLLEYTMNMGCSSVVMPGQALTYDPDKDLMPVILIAGLDNLLYVNPKTPFKTVKEIIDYAKANPGKLTYASSGVGGSYHLWGAQFAYMAGIDMLHVPFRGGPPAIAEIVAGRVDMMFGNLVEVLPFIQSGAVRPIAFTSVPPSPVIPGLPTIAQTLPNYRADNWFGIGAPAGTPPEIVDRLNSEVNKIIKTPEFREKLVSLGFQPLGGSVEDMKQTIQRDRAKWKAVIEAQGIRLE
jgi:tripartite-type tricarboxylate transporter receptor subunit TctC